jgi:hypothetical protein
MICTLRNICAVNLIIAILFVGGYIAYGLSRALPIDQHFLGSGRVKMGRGSNIRVAPWKYDGVAETAILIAFVIGRFTKNDFKVDRAMCLFFGGVGLFTVAVTSLLSSTYTGDEFAYLHTSRLDCLFGVYVYCSHLFYGLSGNKNA